jgi:hypothetical protein
MINLGQKDFIGGLEFIFSNFIRVRIKSEAQIKNAGLRINLRNLSKE